jgi:uncharacterized protein (DUF983 family)
MTFEKDLKEKYEKYSENCKECGREVFVYSQTDNCPEYYTHVFVRCECCGNFVEIETPVN